MPDSGYQPVLHRSAFATACVALLLPITVGALVTTLDAGMAFRDWPSSDGWFMLSYPWLADLTGGAVKKFVEHGHRLAGALVGLVSIGLAVLFWRREPRPWVRGVALAVLLSVVGQGVLGGGRVLFDERVLAMLHGGLAALVFSLMACLAVITSRGWFAAADRDPGPWRPGASRGRAVSARVLEVLAVAAAVVVFGQFLLGGMLRHLGRAVFEHVAFAFVVLACVVAAAVASHRGGTAWTARAGRWMLAAALGQIVLGAAAWLHKFGFAPTGFVAVHGSTEHIVFRTAHTVAGMLLLMTAVVHAVRVYREGRVA
ncbi:MAG TPA: COX15/CtaA family protein [Planctomycetaceae bacterium]|nr:COX15/CtaA family protein [Planctomycetaceae bacterium]